MFKSLKFGDCVTSLKKYGKWIQIFLLTGCMASGTVSLGEEDLNAGALRILSETGDYSAQIYIKEEEKGPVSNEEKKKDKARSEIGMGETVTLTLAGKPQLIGNVSEVKWSIEKGANLAYFNGPTTGTKTVLLTVRNDLTKKGDIKIKVIMGNGGELQLALSAIIPTGIEAKHRRKSYNRTSPDFNKRGVSSNTVDGDRVNAGSSAYLELTFLPKNVSFQGIQIMERDKGCVPALAPDRLATKHKPNPNPVPPNNKNRQFDNVSSRRSIVLLRRFVLPQDWIWKCDWNTYANGKDITTIRTVNQSFHYGWILPNNIATTTVSKFGCSVTRSTELNNKHQFN